MDKKNKFSTFSYKLVQISPIMILVNSGAFLSISSWFCELTELIFVMILYISSTGYPPHPKNAKDYGYVQVANGLFPQQEDAMHEITGWKFIPDNKYIWAGLFESCLTLTQDEKLTEVLIFFFTAYVLCSLRLFKLKTKGQTIQQENLSEKLQSSN